MKKTIKYVAVFVIVLFLNAITANIALSQSLQDKPKQSNPIPLQVIKIMEKSCINCHSEPGKTLALSHVNLSKWDQYSADKQAGKASVMCKEVTKEKMPPRKYRDDHPEAIPTSDEIKTICDWAQLLQSARK